MSHDSMVSTLVRHLSANKFTTIKADMADFEKPSSLSWKATGESFIPDVTAFLNQRGYIFEVETEESVSIQHTKDQCKLFSTYAQEHGSTFCVVVPKVSETSARDMLKSIGAIGDIWTIG